MKKISIIIPVNNENENIPLIADALQKVITPIKEGKKIFPGITKASQLFTMGQKLETREGLLTVNNF